MESGIRARECGLSAILSPGTELRMPPYQRSYAWQGEEVLELLDDLRGQFSGFLLGPIGFVFLVTISRLTIKFAPCASLGTLVLDDDLGGAILDNRDSHENMKAEGTLDNV